MANINLLPWREKLRKEREQHFYILLGAAAALTVVLGIFIHISIDSFVENQNRRNDVLTRNISVLDKEISNIKSLEVEKARLLNRMKVIQKLQLSRPEIVHLFEELVTTLPDGIYLLNVKQKGNTLTLEGVAESNSRISSLMRNMDRSKWLKDPELIVINSEMPKYPNASWFNLRVKRSRPQENP